MTGEKRVVATGCGLATPIGLGVEAFWEALLERRCGIAAIKAFDASGFATRLGAEVPEFKVNDYVPKSYRKSAKVMSRDIQLAVLCAYEAVKDAGLRSKCLIDRGEAEAPPSVDSTRFGANIGAGLICADLAELAGALQTCGKKEDLSFSLAEWGREGMNNLTPLWLLKFLPNMLGCHVTIVHDCQAPSNTITCGEASGHLAVGEAFRTIARGAADVCICGGAESKMNPMGLMRQQLIKRLSLGFDEAPQNACRPFDPSSSGMVAGEAGGLLILEEFEFARKRGARIYGEIVGFGAATDVASWTGPEPAGNSIAQAVRTALADAGITAGDVDLVCTFGSGCNDYDAAELAALRQVFAGRKDISAIALKGSYGNSGAGSGVIDLAAGLLAMRNNTIPPSPNTAASDTAGLLKFAQSDPVDGKINYALSLAYSLAGSQIGAIVMKRCDDGE